MAKPVLIGELTAPHGVRGLMRLRSFAQIPADIFTYTLTDANGVAVGVTRRAEAGGMFIVSVDGVATREAAEQLRGTGLYISRADLPAPAANEFYIADLEGLAVRNAAGETIGSVQRVLNYGAGPVLEIKRTAGAALLLPFTNAFVPQVDVAGGFIIINEPVES